MALRKPAPGLLGHDDEFHRAWSEWKGMPEFVNEMLRPAGTVRVEFTTEAGLRAFEKLIDNEVSLPDTRLGAVWYPKRVTASYFDKRYRADQ